MTTRIHLARPGRYTDMHGRTVALDPQRIRALADSYKPETDKAPLVLGHPKDGAPSYGWVDALSVDDEGNLHAEVSQVAPSLAEAVRAGHYRNVSISWYPKGHANSPTPDTDALRHVGILGAQVPAIRGLEPLGFEAGESGVVTIELSDTKAVAWWGLKSLLRNLRDHFVEREGAETAERIIPAYALDNIDDAGDAERGPAPVFSDPEPEPPMPPKEKSDPEVNLADREADLKKREAAIAARETALADADAKQAEAAAIAFADGLIEEGRLAPAGKEVVADIHRRLAASDEPISFADGTEGPALSAFEKLFKGSQPIIDLSERSAPDQSTDLDSTDPDALTARAQAIQKDNPAIAFSDAVRQAEQEAKSE